MLKKKENKNSYSFLLLCVPCQEITSDCTQSLWWCRGQEHEHVFAVSSYIYAFFTWLCVTVLFHNLQDYCSNNLDSCCVVGFANSIQFETKLPSH